MLKQVEPTPPSSWRSVRTNSLKIPDMITIPVDRFGGLVGDALDGIQSRFAPTWTTSPSSWTNSVRGGLFGLYEGIPLTQSDQDVVDVRRTVIREVGHHFGIGDNIQIIFLPHNCLNTPTRS
jgi:hypothetical protein